MLTSMLVGIIVKVVNMYRLTKERVKIILNEITILQKGITIHIQVRKVLKHQNGKN